MHTRPKSEVPPGCRLEITMSEAARRTLRLRGEVDCSTAPTLRDALRRCERPADGEVVVDLGGVTFLSAAALAVLVEAHQRAASRGDRLLLVDLTRMQRRILAIVGLDRVLLVEDA